MRWILGNSEDIVVDMSQINARTKYIRLVTGTDVSDWRPIQVNGKIDIRFLCCVSNDAVDGTFITAHIGDVYNLLTLRQICESKLIIANTCIWKRLAHKELLYRLRRSNPNSELYFAKQELSIDALQNFRQSTTLLNVGQFGFQTSLSERELFINRRKGFQEALRQSFERVSPILLIGE